MDSRLTDERKPETLATRFEVPEDIKTFEGFCIMDDERLSALYKSLNLAMTLADFKHIQKYYKEEERRDPTVTEIRVLDTY